jgi:hypothetical protein
VAIVVLAVIAVAIMAYRTQQSRRLRERFGPEYTRAVEDLGGSSQAEAALAARVKRVDALPLRDLTQDEQAQFSTAWRSVQTRFVDDPPGATAQADQLVAEVMQARGYPVGKFEQRAADISVDHPDVVEHYRAAHDIALRQARGTATTEDLREAFVHYRSLFEDLLGVQEREEVGAQR